MHLNLAGKGKASRACIPKEVRPNWFTSLLLALTENIQFLSTTSRGGERLMRVHGIAAHMSTKRAWAKESSTRRDPIAADTCRQSCDVCVVV
jgi:hypothetical protein